MGRLDRIKGAAIYLSLVVIGVVESLRTGEWLPVIIISGILAPIFWAIWYMVRRVPGAIPAPEPLFKEKEFLARLGELRAAINSAHRAASARKNKAEQVIIIFGCFFAFLISLLNIVIGNPDYLLYLGMIGFALAGWYHASFVPAEPDPTPRPFEPIYHVPPPPTRTESRSRTPSAPSSDPKAHPLYDRDLD